MTDHSGLLEIILSLVSLYFATSLYDDFQWSVAPTFLETVSPALVKVSEVWVCYPAFYALPKAVWLNKVGLCVNSYPVMVFIDLAGTL